VSRLEDEAPAISISAAWFEAARLLTMRGIIAAVYYRDLVRGQVVAMWQHLEAIHTIMARCARSCHLSAPIGCGTWRGGERRAISCLPSAVPVQRLLDLI